MREILQSWLSYEKTIRDGNLYGNNPDQMLEAGSYWKDVLEAYGLSKEHNVLDIGCGCGKQALHLVDICSYQGLDILEESINFCKENISPNFKLLEFHNDFYSQSEFKNPLPYKDEEFDFIILLSVFTHMMPDDVEMYLEEIKRILKPGGMVFATFFLTSELRPFKRFKLNPIDDYYVKLKEDPLQAIVFNELNIIELYKKHGLEIQDIYYGASEKRGVPNYGRLMAIQDCLVAIKPQSHDARHA